MSSEYLVLHIEHTNNVDAVSKIINYFDDLKNKSDKAKLEHGYFGKIRIVELKGRILNIYSSRFSEKETILSIETSLENEEEVFENIFMYISSLGVHILLCHAKYSATGGGFNLTVNRDKVEWKELSVMPVKKTAVFASGTFSNEYTSPEKELKECGGFFAESPEEAGILLIGKDYDCNLRKEFFRKGKPVVDEDEFYEQYLENTFLA